MLKKLRRNINRRSKEVRAYLHYFKPASSQRTRILIFAQGRTGSSLLEDLICSSGYFQPNREILNKKRDKYYFRRAMQ